MTLTWSKFLLLTVVVLAARLAYLRWLCPYELLGDEAFYWVCSRHLEGGYLEKGPLAPWLIAASTWAFGLAEWSVRLPAAVALALASVATAGLARTTSGGDARVAFVAGAFCMLAPAFQANAQLMTPDALFIAVWAFACWAAADLAVRLERGESAWAAWFCVGAFLGLGLLVKQSMLLFPMGMALYLLSRRTQLRIDARLWLGAGLALAVAIAVASPLLIWNAQRGWPTAGHALWHLGGTGFQPLPAAVINNPDALGLRPLAPLALWLTQVVAFGPGSAVLMVWAVRASLRQRRSNPSHWPAQLLLICLAAPGIAVYTIVAFYKSVELNWPMHLAVSLMALAAHFAPAEFARYRVLLQQWLALPPAQRPKAGFVRRRPETLFRSAWDWVLVYGVAGQLLIAFGPLLISTDAAGALTDRFRGHRDRAALFQRFAAEVKSSSGTDLAIVASHYMTAALLEFYLPGNPRVYCASSLFGARPTSYDLWPNRALEAIIGRDALLSGKQAGDWRGALGFKSVETLHTARAIHHGRDARPAPCAPLR